MRIILKYSSSYKCNKANDKKNSRKRLPQKSSDNLFGQNWYPLSGEGVFESM